MRARPHSRHVAVWLVTLYVGVLAMIAVGGITRLTESGLSIVEWRPVTGAVPPITDAAWEQEFARYRGSPQFAQVNAWMALDDFKRIYFWEFVHRLLGRAIGMLALLPWLAFVWVRSLEKRWVVRTGAIGALVALQGVLGWLMVKSGLLDAPRVSHFRLAAHLVLAFGIGQWVLWCWLHWQVAAGTVRHKGTGPGRSWSAVVVVTAAWLVVQVAFGAFVAGTRGGALFATFPHMNGLWTPCPFFERVSDAWTEPVAIHYTHRALGFGLALPLLVLHAVSRSRGLSVRRATAVCLALYAGQVALGAVTVLLRVPVGVAIAHQVLAYFLVSAVTVVAFLGSSGRRVSKLAVTRA